MKKREESNPWVKLESGEGLRRREDRSREINFRWESKKQATHKVRVVTKKKKKKNYP